ncbi:hypothetical protein M422DRAFT_226418, partial [Sphaerobolus stellatus SS14]
MAASSLAAQLSKSVSLNASLYVDRSKRKSAESYLFTSREADQHDFHTLHALGVNGITRLNVLDPKFEKYEPVLFSEAAKDLDRTLQSEAQNAELDKALDSFLKNLGPYLLESTTGKALEWVVRRFRVNEFNVNSVMALVLPYHETPHFTKMLSILHIDNSPLWSFLEPVKKAATSLPRSILVDAMLSNIDLARFVIQLLPNSIEGGYKHRTLTAFVTSSTVEYLSRMDKSIEKSKEASAGALVAALDRLFAKASDTDNTLAGCVIISAMCQRFSFKSKALVAMIGRILYAALLHLHDHSVLPFIVAILGSQEKVETFKDPLVDSILSLPGMPGTLLDATKWAGSEKLLEPMLPSLTSRLENEACCNTLESFLTYPEMPATVLEQALEILLASVSKDPSNESVVRILLQGYLRHGPIFSQVCSRVLQGIVDRTERANIELVVQKLALPSGSSDGDFRSLVMHSADADVTSRAAAVKEMLERLARANVNEYQALRSRAIDNDPAVITALYSKPELNGQIFVHDSYIETVSRALTSEEISRTVMRLHFGVIPTLVSKFKQGQMHALFDQIYFPYLIFSKPRQKTAALVWQSLIDNEFKYELFKGCPDIFKATKKEDGLSVEEMAKLNFAIATHIAENIVVSNDFKTHVERFLRFLQETDGHILNLAYLVVRALLNQLSGEHQIGVAQQVVSSMGLKSLDSLRDAMASTNLQE